MQLQSGKRVVYLGWLGHSNVGDELLFDVFNERAADAFGPNVRVQAHVPDPAYRRSLDGVDAVVLGGGSLLGVGYYAPIVLEAKRRGLPIVSWGTGLDGLSLAGIKAVRSGGVPDWHRPIDPEALRSVAQSVDVLGVRGPDTAAVLRSVGVEHARVVSDPGLLVRAGTPPVLPEGRPIVAINAGTSRPVFGGEGALDSVSSALAQAADDAVEKGLRPVLFAMWPEDLDACREVRRRMRHWGQATVLEHVYDAPAIAGLLAASRWAIVVKLHAAVLCAAAGTPFIQLAYRSKGLELAQLLGLRGLTTPTSTPDLNGYITTALQHVDDEREVIEARLAAAVSRAETSIEAWCSAVRSRTS